jgi:hypothetical protein
MQHVAQLLHLTFQFNKHIWYLPTELRFSVILNEIQILNISKLSYDTASSNWTP